MKLRPSHPFRFRSILDDPPMPATHTPAISVILVTQDTFATLAKVVDHLQRQTIADRVQVVLVAPTLDALPAEDDPRFAGLHGVERIAVGEIDNVDKAAAPGIRAATAPVVALVEDHAYPEPRYCEALVEAHRGPWVAVGSTIRNANPQSQLSWTNMLLSYGAWVDPVEGGETNDISRHNVSFKRDALMAYGDQLEDKLGRGGDLLPDLLKNGGRFYLEPAAKIDHVNPSRLSSTVALRVQGGRLYAAKRMTRERWPVWKRGLYFAAAPLIPPLRFYRVRRDLFGSGKRPDLAVRMLPALALAVTLDGVGQMLGYATGAGNSDDNLARFEYDRQRHLNTKDRARYG